MAQVFNKSADTWLRLGVLLIALSTLGALATATGLVQSDYLTGRGEAQAQPVPFSHKHHVADDGIDCRFCHTSVETSARAGLPSTQTCMTCHSQLFTDAQILAPVRQSWATRTPIHWTRVNKLPDFVFFDHHVHVAAGVGCNECHGEVDHMPLMRKGKTLTMKFCLDCHKDPAPRLRPPDQVFNMGWKPLSDARAEGEKIIRTRGIELTHLTDCYACHR